MSDRYGLEIVELFLILLLLLRVSVTDMTRRKIGKAETGMLILLALVRRGDIVRLLTEGLICAAAVESVNYFVSRLKGLGGGDIRLMFTAGCLLGAGDGFCALLIGGVCALAAVAACLYRRNRNMTGFAAAEIPFGPFLSLGIAVVLIVDTVQIL
ncbi:MAG: prepilin peptidase [Lachnospiraceae bacterium]